MSTTRRLIGVALSTAALSACSAAGAGVLTGGAHAASARLQPVTATTIEPTPADQRVFVEGDSLTAGISDYLPALLAADGWTVTMDDQIGRTAAAGVGILAERAPEIGGTLVVALGTNDVPDAKVFSALVDQVMAIASERAVIWVTVARAGWGGLDDALTSAATRWANLRVIDWRPVIASHPEMVAADGIHLTPGGYQLRAQFIAAAVERLN